MSAQDSGGAKKTQRDQINLEHVREAVKKWKEEDSDPHRIRWKGTKSHNDSAVQIMRKEGWKPDSISNRDAAANGEWRNSEIRQHNQLKRLSRADQEKEMQDTAPASHSVPQRACTQCKRQKTRCSRDVPSCTNCTRRREQCIYPSGGRQRNRSEPRTPSDMLDNSASVLVPPVSQSEQGPPFGYPRSLHSTQSTSKIPASQQVKPACMPTPLANSESRPAPVVGRAAFNYHILRRDIPQGNAFLHYARDFDSTIFAGEEEKTYLQAFKPATPYDPSQTQSRVDALHHSCWEPLPLEKLNLDLGRARLFNPQYRGARRVGVRTKTASTKW